MESSSLQPISNPENTENFATLDYVKELFLHAVEQQKYEKKRLRTARITLFLVAGMLLVLLVAAVILVPPVNRAIAEAQSVLEKVNELDLKTLSTDVEGFITEANTALQAVGNAAKFLETLDIETLNGAISSLSETVKSFADIDIDMLNKAIKNLNDTVTPFANFFNKF